jgi:hypothetical protein
LFFIDRPLSKGQMNKMNCHKMVPLKKSFCKHTSLQVSSTPKCGHTEGYSLQHKLPLSLLCLTSCKWFGIKMFLWSSCSVNRSQKAAQNRSRIGFKSIRTVIITLWSRTLTKPK